LFFGLSLVNLILDLGLDWQDADKTTSVLTQTSNLQSALKRWLGYAAAGGDEQVKARIERSAVAQNVSFEIAGSSRIYAFHVINAPEAAHDFTVTVQSQALRPNGLWPACLLRAVGRKLQSQTQESLAERHLIIGHSDIEEYLGKQYIPKAQGKKQEIQEQA